MRELNKFYFDDDTIEPQNDIVILRRLERLSVRMVGDIEVTSGNDAGFRLMRAEVVSLGPDAIGKGVEVGDIILYDAYAVFKTTYPICWLRFENIIVIEDLSIDRKFRVIGDAYALVYDTVDEVERNGLVLHDSESTKELFATIVAMGEQCMSPILSIGDYIMFISNERTIQFRYNGVLYFIVQSLDMLINNKNDEETK